MTLFVTKGDSSSLDTKLLVFEIVYIVHDVNEKSLIKRTNCDLGIYNEPLTSFKNFVLKKKKPSFFVWFS